MNITELSPGIFAALFEKGSNVGLINTSAGTVLIDTSSTVGSIRQLLKALDLSPSDVCLVINTHYHGDHIGGNPLFDCPKLGHEEYQKTLPKRKTARVKACAPTEVFGEHKRVEIGEFTFEVSHCGGHTPDSSLVWLPDAKVLFAGDLILAGYYPYIAEHTDFQALLTALKRLPDFGAQVIVPGHFDLCGEAEIAEQIAYLENVWARTVEHVKCGDSLEKTLADPDYPRFEQRTWPNMNIHDLNITRLYRRIVERDIK